MDTNELREKIKSGNLSGVYILGGEEEYLVRYYLKSLSEAAVPEDSPFAVFNKMTFEGEEVDFAAIGEAVKSPPMMDEYKLCVHKRADFSGMKEKELTELAELCDAVSAQGYAVVVFTAADDGLEVGTQKRPSAFVKRFGSLINIVSFDKSTETQLCGWLKKHFDAEGVKVSMDTLKALLFRSGKSMDVLSEEVRKLSCMALARGRDEVLPSDVEEICSSTTECDTFALSTAISERNKALAFEALADLRARRVDPTVVMGMMSKTYGELLSVALLLEDGKGAGDIEGILKINQYRLRHLVQATKKYSPDRLRQITASLARVDADSKFGGIAGYVAIELFLAQNL